MTEAKTSPPAPERHTAGKSSAAPTAETSWLIGRGRLAQSLLLEEAGPSRLTRAAALVIGSMVLALIAWASVTEITEVAVASGEVLPDGSVKRIQHLEGGIVEEIRVREGDLVEAGQVLVRLSGATLQNEIDQLHARLTALGLQAAQLRAVVNGTSLDYALADSRFQDVAQIQRELLMSKREAVEAQANVLRQQIKQRQADLALLADQEETTRRQIKYLSEQVSLRSQLFDKGLTSRVTMLDNQRELARAEGQLAELLGQVRSAGEAIAEAESRLAELDTRMRVDASEQLGAVTAEIVELREALEREEERLQRLDMRSPVRGIVQNLQTETIGGVIGAGSTVLEVIPLDSERIVEARISTTDIGFISVNQPATVKVTTFDYTRYGGIEGEVERISATTVDDEDGNPFYRARIRLAKNYVGTDRTRNLLVPGMTVTADIKTGQKSLTEYLLKPIYRSLSEAFRER